MGMGKIVVEFSPAAISMSVWRLGSLGSALVLAFGLNKLGGQWLRVSKWSSICSPRRHMVEVRKSDIVVVCLVENPAQHF